MNTKKLIGIACLFLAAAGAQAGEDIKGKGGYLGVYMDSVPEVVASQLQLDEGVGVVIEELVKGGPAEESGLKKHDILLRYDDQILIGTKQIVVLVRNSEPGSEHTVTVLRGGESMEVNVTIGEKAKSSEPEEQGFFVPAPPAPPVPPFSEEELVALQARAMAHLEQSLGQIEEREMVVHREFINSDDYTDLMERNEELEVLLARVGAATQNIAIPDVPAVVIDGNHSVIEISDSDSIRYMVTTSGDETTLKIMEKDGNIVYSGAFDEEAKEKLPESVLRKLPKITKATRVHRSVVNPGTRSEQSF